MVFQYEESPASLPLKQGEILCDCVEFIPETGEIQDFSQDTKNIPFTKVHYPLAVVITQECDLLGDWKARQTPQDKQNTQEQSKLLSHIHLCELFEESGVRKSRGLSTDLWKRVLNNQDERYHHFHEASIGGTDPLIPHLYADYKLVFSIPTEYIYWLVSKEISKRKAVIPNIYCLDFIHRLHSFLSRIAVPED